MTGGAPCDTTIRARHRRWSIASAITPVAIALAANASLGQAPSVQVPSVVGQTFDQAVCILQLHGLRTQKPPYVPPPILIANEPVVASQVPPWRAQVPPGTLVQVRLRPAERAPSVSAVPVIPSGARLAAARGLLEKYDMCVKVTPPQALKFPQAVVVRETLADKSPVSREIPRGTRIVLYAGIPVPSVVGQLLAGAETILQRAGLTVGPIARTGPASPSETVTDQRPASGTLVAIETPVSLTVTGPTAPPHPSPNPRPPIVERRTVPYLVGESLDDALRDIETHGFAPGPVARQASNETPGTVVDQTPSGGTEVLLPLPDVSLWVAAIEVPDVVGRPIGDAVAALKGAGLSARTITLVASGGSPGVVVSQSIPSGSLIVPPLEPVDLTESAVAVPSVTERTLEDATRALQAVGLKIGSVSLTHAPAPLGTVTRQTPAAGTLVVPPFPGIDVMASALPMPALIGQSREAAAKALADVGLEVGSWVPAASVKQRGTVIDQDPAADTLLSPPFPPVGVTIAAVHVPNVVGQSAAAARQTLASAGLNWRMPEWSGLPFVTVAGQDPPAGALITEASAFVALGLDFRTFRNLSALSVLVLTAGVVAARTVVRGRSSIRSQVEVRRQGGAAEETGIYLDGIPVSNGHSLIVDPAVQLRLNPDPGIQSMAPTDVIVTGEEDGRV